LKRATKKQPRERTSTAFGVYLLLVFFRLERAEPASVFVVLLEEGFFKALLAAEATFEEVRTEFAFAIHTPPF